MTIGSRVRAISATLVALAMFGCAGGGTRPATFSSWQSQVQAYVVNHGNGDMNALRDVTITPGQPGFLAFNNDRPEKSKDIAGVLVGVRPAQDRLWYVYLVSDIDKEQVTSMRLAAISQNGSQYVWRVGVDDAGGTQAYLAHCKQVWREHHGDAGDPPRRAFDFPNPGDQFTMSAAGESVAVKESASGAQWTLSLADAPAAAKPRG